MADSTAGALGSSLIAAQDFVLRRIALPEVWHFPHQCGRRRQSVDDTNLVEIHWTALIYLIQEVSQNAPLFFNPQEFHHQY